MKVIQQMYLAVLKADTMDFPHWEIQPTTAPLHYSRIAPSHVYFYSATFRGVATVNRVIRLTARPPH